MTWWRRRKRKTEYTEQDAERLRDIVQKQCPAILVRTLAEAGIAAAYPGLVTSSEELPFEAMFELISANPPRIRVSCTGDEDHPAVAEGKPLFDELGRHLEREVAARFARKG